MKQKSPALRRLAEGSMIAAMYTALTLAVPAASFGLSQFRISEILTILPVFTPAAIPGLAVGCLLSNIAGLALGANLAGGWDIIFGPLATLSAAWLSYLSRNIRWFGLPVLSTLPPVLINAVVIGLELTLILLTFNWVNFAAASFSVFVGQFAACTVFGLIFYILLNRTGAGALFTKKK